ncbi:preprotein translocase secY subunit [Lachnospiraceae bacterium KM106-2]|nr:preprotein translocase secY subunit [Lachnospiraceae bacterium KM106-2]
MFKTVRNAFKIKDIRNKILFTFMALLVVRLGSQLPVVGLDRTAVANAFSNSDALGFLDALTGGSFTNFSIFALNISPYITASIIIQLLTIAIPKLEELQKDGEDGRKKLTEYTRYLTIVLAVIEALAMVIGFKSQNFLKLNNLTDYIVIVSSMTAGAAFLMWLGERITEKGVGNGISIILLINIVSRMPQDISSLYDQFIKGASNVFNGVIAAVIIIAVIVAMVVFIIILSDAERRIPVQYAKKVQGRKMVGGQTSSIPLKVNTAGVIPVIFASSLMSVFVLVSSFFGVHPQSGAGATLWQKILKVLNSSSWCNFSSLGEFKYTLGLVVYIVLIIFFAYFYTTITFNPIEVSNNMKKQGGFIPGIRPGKPTTDYLTKVLNNIIFIGAIGLAFVAFVPILFSGAFGASVSFGGTSLIIVVGVVLETIKQVESQMLVRHYRGFLND